ncbi:flavin-containing monooxygenase [Tistrella mobilis]|uniref:flavin-containing monooxygenase n=1 Tax=Tistrella mobilis TaxID=171437 RepID=UPI0035590B24
MDTTTIGSGSAGAEAADLRAVDVLVIGAGLSGVAAGYHLQTRCPGIDYAILEARDAIGGTWDLFRYPGIRSDSDMYTLGFGFRPWIGDKVFADGPSIRDYVRDTAAEFGIDRRILFGHRVVSADWDSATARWRVLVEAGPERRPRRFTCRVLYACSGYYDYAAGHMPDWPGMADFRGRIIHPQDWPADLDHRGKRVVVIGSGATAVTLVPALAESAAHVTMLQRSPTYIVARPSRDAAAGWLRRHLPERLAFRAARWKNVLLSIYFYNLARRKPALVKSKILAGVRHQLGPDQDRHFTPAYDPWDQRLCLVPDGDLFRAIRAGTASVVTDGIERFTETGLRLTSGEELAADIVVAATGLRMKLLAHITLSVDGRPVRVGETTSYKGMMLSGVPNFALALGYTNASWTLKCELTAQHLCRLIRRMDARGADWFMPRPPAPGLATRPAIDLASGYVRRAAADLPRQGDRKPWRLNQNYLLDMAALRYGSVVDDNLAFGQRRDAGGAG